MLCDSCGAWFIPEALRVAGEFLPGFINTWWIEPFAANPLSFLVSIALIAAPILIGLQLETAIQDRMLAAWRGDMVSNNWLTRALDTVQVFRTTAWYRALLRFIKYKLAPNFLRFSPSILFFHLQTTLRIISRMQLV